MERKKILTEAEKQLAAAWHQPNSQELLKDGMKAAIVDMAIDPRTKTTQDAFVAQKTQAQLLEEKEALDD